MICSVLHGRMSFWDEQTTDLHSDSNQSPALAVIGIFLYLKPYLAMTLYAYFILVLTLGVRVYIHGWADCQPSVNRKLLGNQQSVITDIRNVGATLILTLDQDS